MATRPQRSTRSNRKQSHDTSASQRGRGSSSGNWDYSESKDSESVFSPGDRSVSSKGSTGTKAARGLPAHLLKQLALDIETGIQGGIQGLKNKEDNTHVLSQLLDSREDSLYGKRGDAIRSKIGKYVDRWKNLSSKDYREKVLEKFQVAVVQRSYLPSKQEEDKDLSSSEFGHRSKPIKKQVQQEASFEDNSSDDSSLPAPVKQQTKTKYKSLASAKAHEDLPDIISLSLSSPTTKMSRDRRFEAFDIVIVPCLLHSSNCLFAPTSFYPGTMVAIDVKKPGDQGEGIHCFQLLPHHVKDGVSYRGFQLELDVVPRDVEKGHYWIDYVEGDNKLVLYKPAMACTYLEDIAQHSAREASDEVKTGHAAARSAFSKLSTEAKSTKFTLVFPSSYKLTQKPFGVATGHTSNETAQHEVLTYKYNTDFTDRAGNQLYQIVTRLTWKFCDQGTATSLTVTSKGGRQSMVDSFSGM
jgi:hypothetical protein